MLGPERVFPKTWTCFSFSFIYNSYKQLLGYIVHKRSNNKNQGHFTFFSVTVTKCKYIM